MNLQMGFSLCVLRTRPFGDSMLLRKKKKTTKSNGSLGLVSFSLELVFLALELELSVMTGTCGPECKRSCCCTFDCASAS